MSSAFLSEGPLPNTMQRWWFALGKRGAAPLNRAIFSSETAVFTVLKAAYAIRLCKEAVADIFAKVFGMCDYYCRALVEFQVFPVHE